jgi:hypothetical protein
MYRGEAFPFSPNIKKHHQTLDFLSARFSADYSIVDDGMVLMAQKELSEEVGTSEVSATGVMV